LIRHFEKIFLCCCFVPDQSLVKREFELPTHDLSELPQCVHERKSENYHTGYESLLNEAEASVLLCLDVFVRQFNCGHLLLALSTDLALNLVLNLFSHMHFANIIADSEVNNERQQEAEPALRILHIEVLGLVDLQFSLLDLFVRLDEGEDETERKRPVEETAQSLPNLEHFQHEDGQHDRLHRQDQVEIFVPDDRGWREGTLLGR